MAPYPAQTPKNHYDALGLHKGASLADIKLSFRRLAMAYHPDKNPGDEYANALFKCINLAYETLRDSGKRAAYDSELEKNRTDPGYANLSRPNRPASSTTNGPVARRGENIRLPLEVTLDDLRKKRAIVDFSYTRMDRCGACHGHGHVPEIHAKPVACSTCNGSGFTEGSNGKMKLRQACSDCHAGFVFLSDACPTCLGAGRLAKKRKIEITLPAGAHDEAVVRIPKGGHIGPWGGEYGDLLLEMVIKAPDGTNIIDGNILATLFVDPFTLITGGKIDMPEQTVTIPPNTRPGERIFLKGQGLPRRGKDEPGDFILLVEIEWPCNLNPKQLKAIQACRASLEPSENLPSTHRSIAILKHALARRK